jgi:hypothetical protein
VQRDAFLQQVEVDVGDHTAVFHLLADAVQRQTEFGFVGERILEGEFTVPGQHRPRLVKAHDFPLRYSCLNQPTLDLPGRFPAQDNIALAHSAASHIGLLLPIEVLSRVPWPSGWLWILARVGGIGIVALGSAIISYGHLRDVLIAWHYEPLAAAVGPLVLDGLMVVSGFALLTISRSKRAAECR